MKKQRKNSVVLDKNSMNSKNLSNAVSKYYPIKEEYVRVEKAYIRMLESIDKEKFFSEIEFLMMITRINVKILRNKTKTITVVCCCNTKKNDKKIDYNRLKRINTEACNFRINFEINEDSYTFINFRPHNHGPFLSEFKFISNYKNMKISEMFIHEYTSMLLNSIESINELKNTSDYFSGLNSNIEHYRKDFMNQLRNIDSDLNLPPLIDSFSKRYREYFFKRDCLDGKKRKKATIEEQEINIKNTHDNSNMIAKKRKKINNENNNEKAKEKSKLLEPKDSNIYDIVTNFTSYEKIHDTNFSFFSFNDDQCSENQNSKLLDEYDKKSLNSDLYLNNDNINQNQNNFVSNNNSPIFFFNETGMQKFQTNLCTNNRSNNGNIMNQSNQLNCSNITKNAILDNHKKDYNFNSCDIGESKVNITTISLSPTDKTDTKSSQIQINNIYINQNSNSKSENRYCANFLDMIKEFQKNCSKKLKVFMEFLNLEFQKKVKEHIDNKEELCRESLKKFLLHSIAFEKKANFLTYEIKYRLENILNADEVLKPTLPKTNEYAKYLTSDAH